MQQLPSLRQACRDVFFVSEVQSPSWCEYDGSNPFVKKGVPPGHDIKHALKALETRPTLQCPGWSKNDYL